jgi:hypothetical protein
VTSVFTFREQTIMLILLVTMNTRYLGLGKVLESTLCSEQNFDWGSYDEPS